MQCLALLHNNYKCGTTEKTTKHSPFCFYFRLSITKYNTMSSILFSINLPLLRCIKIQLGILVQSQKQHSDISYLRIRGRNLFNCFILSRNQNYHLCRMDTQAWIILAKNASSDHHKSEAKASKKENDDQRAHSGISVTRYWLILTPYQVLKWTPVQVLLVFLISEIVYHFPTKFPIHLRSLQHIPHMYKFIHAAFCYFGFLKNHI